MVHFQSTASWSSIKSFKNPYFTWLKKNRVYLNYTKFKTETLVACGFLVGTHPGHLRREEAEEELRGSLGLDKGEIDFQLSSRSISVPIKEGDTSCYSFQAIIIETSTKLASTLHERFFELAHPSKVFNLAQVHVNIVSDLRSIYINNLQDINTIINEAGESLMQGLYILETSACDSSTIRSKLLHSVHNTARPTTKVALGTSSKYEDALGQLTNLQNILINSVPIDYHQFIFVPGQAPQVSGPRVDSIMSCAHSSFADELLHDFPPQQPQTPSAKRFRQTHLTYAKVTGTLDSTLTPLTEPSTVQLDNLYEQVQERLSLSFVSRLDIATLEQQAHKTANEISNIQDSFTLQLATVTKSVDTLATQVNSQYQDLSTTVNNLTATIECQNAVIAKIQQDFKLSMETLATTLTKPMSLSHIFHSTATASSPRLHNTAG
jgi:hypothetical protein